MSQKVLWRGVKELIVGDETIFNPKPTKILANQIELKGEHRKQLVNITVEKICTRNSPKRK